jgi:hypothetical protein
MKGIRARTAVGVDYEMEGTRGGILTFSTFFKSHQVSSKPWMESAVRSQPSVHLTWQVHEVERAFVHVDYSTRGGVSEHKEPRLL